MSTTSDGEHSYPSWLPRRPPPPAPASTFHSTSGYDMHGRPGVLDIFSGAQTNTSVSVSSPAQVQGRKPTPRSVRIIARDAEQWRVGEAGSRSRLREQTGDSAETRVVHQHPNQSLGRHHHPRGYSSMHASAPHRPQPRFRAPSLHLDLLRSPTIFMRVRHRLHLIFVFGHLILQTFFDFNAVFMIVQTAKHPGPTDNPKNWNLATAAYLACYFLQIFVVFLIYELVYSFWRRWRVKRPLILPIYLSSAAHNLVGLTSYTNYCFLAYIRRSARPSFRLLLRTSSPPLIRSTRAAAPPTSPSGSESPHPHSPADSRTHARSESMSSTTTSDTSTSSSAGFLSFLTPFTPWIAESAYFLSQNTPTVVLLLPRATLCVALLLQVPAGSNLGRDSTYFDANGALTGYARGVLFANAAWTLWRTIVLLGSFTTLWILSGSACAGICGPRYRWEEYPDPESEVEIDDEDGGWAFVNLNPWLRAHPRRHRRRRRRITSESIADREIEQSGPREGEHGSLTSSFFSPVSPPVPSEIGAEHSPAGGEKSSPPPSPQIHPISPAQPRSATRTTSHAAYTHYPVPPARAYMAEDLSLSDTWNWKRGTRRRIREAWEFCLTNAGGKWSNESGSGGPVDSVGKKDGEEGDDSPRTRAIIQHRAAAAAAAAAMSDLEGSGDNDISLNSEDFKGLDEVLKQSALHRNVLRSRPKFSPPAVGLSDIIPPPDDPLLSFPDPAAQVHSDPASPSTLDPAFSSQFGSQRSRRSDPLRVLPFPIRVGPVSGSGDGTGKVTTSAAAIATTPSSPPPSASGPSTAGLASSSTAGTPAMPATPTTATTLTMTGIPFPSPTRSRSRTRLPTQVDETGAGSNENENEEEEVEEEEEGEEEEGEEEEEEEGEGEDYEEEEEIEDYDDDFLEEGEAEDEEDYENGDEFDPEADIEEYDEEYDLSGSPHVEEDEELYYDEFGAPVTSRRRRHTSASARSGTVSRSGSASMSSLGRPIEGGVSSYGGYAFSTVGSATMSSASRSGGHSGTRSASHGGSRMGTVSSRGSRGTRTSFSPGSASASVSASRSGATGSGSGTRSSRGSASANVGRGDSASTPHGNRVRRGGRGRGNTDTGRSRGVVIATAPSASALPQALSSASPHSQVQVSLTPGSLSSPNTNSSPSNGESPSSPGSQNRRTTQSFAGPHPLDPPPSVPLPSPPTAIHGQGSGARRERRRPRREGGREYTGHLHAPDPVPRSGALEPSSAGGRARTDSSTVPTQPGEDPALLSGAGDTSLDIAFPVPADVYAATGSGGGGRRSRRTSTAGTSTVGAGGGRRRTRTMSSGFSGRGADLVLPRPMPEGYREEPEDQGDAGREDLQEGVSYLGRIRGGHFPVTDIEEGDSVQELEHETEASENEDILGLLSSSRPASGPVSVSGSAPASRSASASASPHTRSPRTSLKSISSKPSLANLAASLGANLNAGARHLSVSSRRVSFTGTPSRGSRSQSREGSFVQSGSGGTPPPLPSSQPSIRSRAQSLIQSIRNRSSSFVELVEMREDGNDEAVPVGEYDQPPGDVHGEDDDGNDMTIALPPASSMQPGPSILAGLRDNDDNTDLRYSSPIHSSDSSPASNNNSLTHTPSSNSHSPLSRIIGVPPGFEFGTSRRESSGTSSSSPSGSGGARSSGEGRRPLSLLSAASGLNPTGTGTEGTFGRPGELAGFVRRERELAGEHGDDMDSESQRMRSLSSALAHGPLHTIPSMDLIRESGASLTRGAQGEDDDPIESVDQSHTEGLDNALTRTEPISIPNQGRPRSPPSPSALSTAPASFITAPPSVAFTHTSTTESVYTARGAGSGTEQGSENASTGNGSGGSSGRGANTSIDPIWRDQTRRGARGPVAGSWHMGPA